MNVDENDHNHRKLAGLGLFLSQGVINPEPKPAPKKQVPVKHYEPTTSVKDYARPFFCKTCHIDCTSDSALEAHLNGKNHMKKLRQLGKIFKILIIFSLIQT